MGTHLDIGFRVGKSLAQLAVLVGYCREFYVCVVVFAPVWYNMGRRTDDQPTEGAEQKWALFSLHHFSAILCGYIASCRPYFEHFCILISTSPILNNIHGGRQVRTGDCVPCVAVSVGPSAPLGDLTSSPG